MVSPFPGMDPYLEEPALWRAVHSRLISAIDEALSVGLPPQFISTIEERVYLAQSERQVGPDVLLLQSPQPQTASEPTGNTRTLVAQTPYSLTLLDEEVYEPYVEIRLAGRPERVIAVIEVLSPSNKSREAYGRDSYVKKRDQILSSDVHLIEIDLLRGGLHTIAPRRDAILTQIPEGWDYITCLHRAGEGKTYHYWPCTVRQPLPIISIPLSTEYEAVPLDLQACLNHVYEVGNYQRRIDYATEPTLPFRDEDTVWADNLLREKGFR